MGSDGFFVEIATQGFVVDECGGWRGDGGGDVE